MARGRTSKYDTHVKPRLDEIYQWAKKGLLDNEIYTNLNIGKNAFYQYLNKYEELKDTLTRGRTTSVDIVVNELFKNCVGYPYWEDKSYKCREKIYNDSGDLISDIEVIKTVSEQKYSPGNTQAQMFYLTNRDKKEWASNPHNNDLKREEIELRRKLAEEKDIWE